MSTSATSIFNPTAQALIDLAWADLGANGIGVSPDPNLRPSGLTVLSLLLKRMDAEGIFTWKRTRRTQTLIGGTASYVLANDVSDVMDPMRYTQVGATAASQVSPMTIEEYMRTYDRTIQGISLQYFAEKALGADGIEFITLRLFPVPPSSGDTLEYAAVLRMLDVTSVAQTLDVPQKFLNAIRWGLVAELAPSCGAPPDRVVYFSGKYQAELALAIGDDHDHAPLQMVPWGNSVSYGYGPWGGGYR